MVQDSLITRASRSIRNLRSDWIEIGGLGRLAVVGVVLAMALTLLLGFSITRSARGHLLDARAVMVTATVADLPPFPQDSGSSLAEMAAFDVAVRVKVLGGETVRVKVWSRSGEIVYSELGALVGQVLPLPEGAAAAFEAGVDTRMSDLSDAAHIFERNHGELIEVFVVLPGGTAAPAYVIEVEQDASGLEDALSQIARNVWISIGVGLVAIGFVMAVGIAARTREVNRRRRQAEALLTSSFTAQEEERARIVSALHDDIGQPMYRLLYGLEGSRAKLDESDPVAIELAKLSAVVRNMDTTLRNELRLLNFELAADAGLAVALGDLVELTRAETDLDIDLDMNLDFEPSAISRTEIYRAAREAIMNVRKHTSADQVRVRVYERDNRIILDVTDNGQGGIESSDVGLGLSTTRERFVALDGDVTLESVLSGDTRFTAWLPKGERRR